MELGPSTETTKNLWDETDIVDNGYEPNMSVDPYYGDKLTFEILARVTLCNV